jgi:esterase/lipase superfamily enzyme
VLAAPDVDRDAFEFLASEIRDVANGVTLYAAANDKALDASRIFAGNRPRAGDVPLPPQGPVVVTGIDTIDISAVSTAYLSLNHSLYAEHSDLLTDLGQLLRTDIRPPDKRISAYKRIEGAGGAYWRYGN